MRDGYDFDHTSIGVEDLPRWASVVRRELGGFVLTGQDVGELTYLLFHVGEPPRGGGLELIAPRGDDGFMHRFVRRHGDGFHHLTFTVPDVEETTDAIERLGLTIHSRQLVHGPWREGYVAPDAIHGVLIQLADTTHSFPPLADLSTTTARDVAAYPHNLGGSTHEFWSEVWDIDPLRQATVLRTHLSSADPDLSRALFGDVLHGETRREGEADVFTWGGTELEVGRSDHAGIIAMTIEGLDGAGLSIGSALLRPS